MALRSLEEGGFVRRRQRRRPGDRLVNDAAQKALERFDEVMRELALLRYTEFDRELGPVLTRFVLDESVRRFRRSEHSALAGRSADEEVQRSSALAEALASEYGPAPTKTSRRWKT